MYNKIQSFRPKINLCSTISNLKTGLSKSETVKLRSAAFLAVTVTLASLLGALYTVSSNLLLSNVKVAEEHSARQSVNEAVQQYAKSGTDIYYTNLVWSKWDETHNFIEQPNKDYIANNFNPQILSSWKLNLIALVHKSGRVVFAQAGGEHNKKFISIPQSLKQHIHTNDLLLQQPNSNQEVTGFLLLPEGLMLIASLPIVHDDGQGPSCGAFIIGRYVKTTQIAKSLADTTEGLPSVYAANSKTIPPDFQAARSSLSEQQPIVVRSLNQQKIAAYTWLKDIYGKPILLLRVEKERQFYQQGKNNLHYLRVALLFLAIGFGSITLLLLDRLIIFQYKRQESEARYRIVVGQASESIFLVDAQTKHFIEANQAFIQLIGYSCTELLNLTLNDVVALENSQNLEQMFAQADRLHGFHQYRRKDGNLVDVEVSINIIFYAGRKVVCHVVRDITERKQAEMALLESERRLAWQASHDALTGLVNRRQFDRYLEQALNNAKLSDTSYCLCYLDLDQFKVVNDTCGHIAGDELLRQVTALLQAQVRSVDILARLGGDEFGLLLHDCNLEQAASVANALRESIEAFRFIWEDKTFRIGVSIGLVGMENDDRSLSKILSAADVACYAAKNQGRNRVHIYQTSDRNLAQQQGDMQWIARIDRALEENRFCLYYQSIVPTSPHAPGGEHYEVLLRLRDEQGELVPPMAFIPAAERYNLMHVIDRWVIRTLFATQAPHYRQSWQRSTLERYECLYTINLSGASINDDSFIEFLHQQILMHQIPPQVLCFEITETVAITNLTKAINFMQQFKRLGCSFALDDFGSGMSSFGYLKNLPVDYLKIDGNFVKDILTDATDLAMTEAINTVGHVMGIKTIAEFVENEAILDKLRALGVDYAQGYGIAKPMPLPTAQLCSDYIIPDASDLEAATYHLSLEEIFASNNLP
ncbi:bifunctional diguanylate cyclase/phosphodiesterase [Aliterella atlantica]|uniref:bifunctional diguanylate cyclase/phosphodiesterase n=1 Tax=Aliterella atlantica TaxID=1827278 RepID=UPI0006985783|nr:EAL domain-containing protein [Aliterella atlantica]